MRTISLLALAQCGAATVGCGGSESTAGDYLVDFQIVGSVAAFEGRAIEVEGKIAPPARRLVSADPELRDMMVTELGLCTHSHDRFLTSPTQVVVLAGDVPISETSVDRVACRLSTEEGGDEEGVQVFLEEDGTIVADWDDPRTETYCAKTGIECSGGAADF
jgi:hypothetical protein